MKLRNGLILGAAIGYYFGAKAGRQRYEQIRDALERSGAARQMDTAVEKAKAVVDLGVERARDIVESHSPGHNNDDELDLDTLAREPLRVPVPENRGL